jgi:hypothetical protein
VGLHYMYIHIAYVYIHIHMYVCIYICIHTHVHSHTHTHTHMQDVGPVRGSAAMVSQAENWKLLQTIGDKPGGTLVDGDVVSAVEFDEQVYSYTQTGDVFACEHRRTHTHTHTHIHTHEQGEYLATGDRAGRVRIYRRTELPPSSAGWQFYLLFIIIIYLFTLLFTVLYPHHLQV